jgi:hypothetical protein
VRRIERYVCCGFGEHWEYELEDVKREEFTYHERTDGTRTAMVREYVVLPKEAGTGKAGTKLTVSTW